MKPNGKVAAVVVLACAVVGCSKRGDSQKAKNTDSAQPKAVEALTPSPAKVDGEGFVGTPAPKISGPVSYADGEAAYREKKYADATMLFEAYTTQKPGNAWGQRAAISRRAKAPLKPRCASIRST
jgi:hypothetical protein